MLVLASFSFGFSKTSFGILALVLGCLCLVLFRGKVKFTGLLLVVGGCCIGLGGNPSRDFPRGIPALEYFGYVCAAASILIPIISDIQFALHGKKTGETIVGVGSTPQDRFFVECVLADCTDFSLEKNVQRAEAFARKYGLKYPNGIAKLYESARIAHEEISAQISSVQNTKKKVAEESLYKSLVRYADFDGKEKRRAMLSDRKKELEQASKDMDYYASLVARSGQQKESSWAIWGGIADGLAGPAAGIMTAIEVEAQNEKIRAQNEAQRQRNMPLYMAISKNSSDNWAHAKQIERELQLLPEKLVSRQSSASIMEQLVITNTTIDASETGACMVTATISAKNKLFIYDDVPAVADGYVIAHICEDGVEVGTAKMVLPVNGVSDATAIAGMILSGAHSSKTQTVTFSAGNLWLMEA